MRHHTRKSLFHQSPPLPSFVFNASPQNHDAVSKWNIEIIQIYTSLFCLTELLQWLVCRELAKSSAHFFLLTFFLFSHATTSFRVAHIHVSALLRKEGSKRNLEAYHSNLSTGLSNLKITCRADNLGEPIKHCPKTQEEVKEAAVNRKVD